MARARSETGEQPEHDESLLEDEKQAIKRTELYRTV